MDSQQFYQMLKDARKTSGLTWVQVESRMGCSHPAVIQLFSVKIDSGMFKLIEYTNAIKAAISLTLPNGDTFMVYSPQTLTEWMRVMWAERNNMQLAKEYGVSHQTIGRILNGGNFRLSIFLKTANNHNVFISIEPREVDGYSGIIDDAPFDFKELPIGRFGEL